MSFGYSAGDFIAIGQLTWNIYRSCKSAPGEFQELSHELSSLHTILHELEDEAQTPSSVLNRRGSGRKAELDRLMENLSGVLTQIEDIVKRYHSLGRDQKKTWDRVRFATENLTELKAKLMIHTNAINIFISSLSAGSLARIEGILDELVRDIREGRKEPSVISSATYEEDDELAWGELEKELVGDGITRQDVERYKEEIKEYLKKLIKESMKGFEPKDDVFTDSESQGFEVPLQPSSDSIRAESLAPYWDLMFDGKNDSQISGHTESSNEVKARLQRYSESESRKSVHDLPQTKPISFVRAVSLAKSWVGSLRLFHASVKRVLRELGLDFQPIRGGFSCSCTLTVSGSMYKRGLAILKIDRKETSIREYGRAQKSESDKWQWIDRSPTTPFNVEMPGPVIDYSLMPRLLPLYGLQFEDDRPSALDARAGIKIRGEMYHAGIARFVGLVRCTRRG